MSAQKKYDISIIGGGIVGLASAYKLQKKYPNLKIAVFDKNAQQFISLKTPQALMMKISSYKVLMLMVTITTIINQKNMDMLFGKRPL